MKRMFLISSHAILVLAGWAAVTALRKAPEETVAFRATKGGERTRAEQPQPGQLLAQLRTKLQARQQAKPKEYPMGIGSGLMPAPRDKVHERAATIRLTADVPAALGALLGDDISPEEKIEASALLLAWGRKDLKAAAAFVSAGAKFQGESALAMGIEIIGEEIDPATGLRLSIADEAAARSLVEGLARQLASGKPPEEVAALLEGNKGQLASAVSESLSSEWPATRFREFARLAVLMDSPAFLVAFTRKNRESADTVPLLLELLDRHPDPSFIRRMTEESSFEEIFLDAREIPVELRVKALLMGSSYEGKPPAEAREMILEKLVAKDLPSVIEGRDGPDLVHAYAQGQQQAGDILAQLARRFPEYAASDALRKEVFSHLAARDPRRAAALLEGLPEDARTAAFTRAMARYPEGLTPPDILHIISMAPAPDSGQAREDRYHAWGSIFSTSHFRSDGDHYITWVLNLPPGADRDMALCAAADSLKDEDAVVSEEIRSLIQDPFLKARR